jgi:hypothetical protein
MTGRSRQDAATKDSGEEMKESFDALIDHLVGGEFFLEQAVEILEKGMIERALRRRNQSVGSQQGAGHPSQHAAAQDGASIQIGGRHPRRKPAAQRIAENVPARARPK